jgi:hypothetical protein
VTKDLKLSYFPKENYKNDELLKKFFIGIEKIENCINKKQIQEIIKNRVVEKFKLLIDDEKKNTVDLLSSNKIRILLEINEILNLKITKNEEIKKFVEKNDKLEGLIRGLFQKWNEEDYINSRIEISDLKLQSNNRSLD